MSFYQGRLTIPKMSRLDEEQKKVEQELVSIVENREEADKAYNKIRGSLNGKVLCVDLARYLSPAYRSNKPRSRHIWTPATFNPAMVYIVDRLDREIRNSRKNSPLLLILTGGPGSGKTTCVKLDKIEEADLIFDGTMTRFEADQKLIDQTLLFGWRVELYFVHRPYHDMVLSMLQRTQLTGRYVGLGKGKDMSRMHVESLICFEQAFYNFRERRNIEFYVVEPKSSGEAVYLDVKEFLSRPRPTVKSLLTTEEKAMAEFIRSGGDERVVELCQKGTRLQTTLEKREHNHLYWNKCNL
ncbi:P-loop containing nucleoside triphosphate hydrolase [Cedratvirus A11]|uniref:p-loop containing nucleoside triphosphate hydrolase n=1 Tax=Cedratvirus A11 TaxID=1903266 RepID=A0A1M7XTS2_9VIRU|nr:P-loop containing nucleoside triphosphate hydrolase [Cedratvirus A11]SHO33077.1 P-loop containing nucleoside triphosphate hydrolase [Cedratvirus A11]